MTDHEYDGIRELDNRLPEWWLALFGITIIFGFIYWLHYEFGGGHTQVQELNLAMGVIQSVKGSGPSFSEDQLNALFTAETVGKGHEIFTAKCAACHAAEGGGLIGPNLTDKFWLHGKGTSADIFEVIAKGVPEKGMPPWAEQMTEEELVATAAFVHSLKDRNVPGGKPPQGEEAP
ncbi:MAG: c-type cytochrome [Bdellovibrionaceae bacterium]|nr:c-type cytochrome [Pseudobdellovibrionaceae bacterium]MBX3034032.1 c-type cytochrome [Pseudobdellovibrionaceae bacterium]